MKAPAVNAPVTKALDIASLNSVIIYSQMLKFLLYSIGLSILSLFIEI